MIFNAVQFQFSLTSHFFYNTLRFKNCHCLMTKTNSLVLQKLKSDEQSMPIKRVILRKSIIHRCKLVIHLFRYHREYKRLRRYHVALPQNQESKVYRFFEMWESSNNAQQIEKDHARGKWFRGIILEDLIKRQVENDNTKSVDSRNARIISTIW